MSTETLQKISLDGFLKVSFVWQDAHTEANIGWLEPMLYELKKHPDSIVQPFVDGIDAGNIEYTAPGEIYTGSFSWDLRYV